MHWWQLPFSSPSKSQSAAADMLIAGAESEKTGVFSSRWSCGKVRQLTQNDADEWRSKSCSPHSRSRSSSASASAQPLPLPEFVCTPSHNVPLPSPAAGWSRRGGCGEERERLAAERRGLDQQLKSRLVGNNTRTSVEQPEVRLSRKSPVKQSANKRSSCSRIIIIPKSAPTSPVSSPPRMDKLATYYMTPPGIFHSWSEPEIPHSNGNKGLSSNYQMPSDIISLHVDDSSLVIPTLSYHFHVESSHGTVLPLPSKITSESPVARRENISQANVHTLPLPPGADMPTMPSPLSSNSSTSDLSGATYHVVGNPEPMAIKSQWQKGKLIGRGTFGSVYVASNRETGALCAMKEVEILPEDVKSQESMRQLKQVGFQFSVSFVLDSWYSNYCQCAYVVYV